MGSLQYTVLMIEDNLGDARLINEMLSETGNRQIKLEHVIRLSTGLERVKEGGIDLILLDLGLPDSTGLNTLVNVRKEEERIPIVVLTGLEDEELGITAVKMGAQDYLNKMQINSYLLSRSLRYAIERQKAEERIRESEERFRSTFEQAAVGIAHIDSKGNWLRVNQKLCNILNYSKEELLEKKFQDITFSEDRKVGLEKITEVFKGELKNFVVEERLVRKDNSIVWINLTVSSIENLTENDIYVIAVIEDISERKLAEKALQESEKKFSTIFREVQSPVIMSMLTNNKIVDVNHAFVRITGYSSQEVIGKTSEEINLYYNVDFKKSIVSHINKNHSIHDYEIQFKKKDGEIGFGLLSSVKIMINEEPFILTVISDITERVKAEEKNNEYLKELQLNKEVLERKSKELADLNINLNELNASKDKFFSIVAHDLRSPFTALLGISDFLNKHSDEMSYSEIKEFTLHLNQSLTGVFRLIENLLQWSRVQTGRMEFNPEIFNFNNLLDEISELYKANANNKSINIEKVLPKEVFVYGDRYMIETVLRNLLSNAIKFTSPKGKVSVEVCNLENIVEVKVSDNGIGIPDEDIPKLFKIDETLTTEGTLNEKGTGLGLVLCKEFVEKNGGEIWVESNIGRGSNFIFTLPKSSERIRISR